MTKDKLVTKYVFDLIAKQVEDHRLVVWYDPEQAFSAVAADLELPITTVVRHDGSFFQLRRDIDALLNDEQPPRLIVYIPEDRGDTHNALVELEAAGVGIQPGQQPPNRNTRLAIIARNAMKSILGEETASEIEKQVESGKWCGQRHAGIDSTGVCLYPRTQSQYGYRPGV